MIRTKGFFTEHHVKTPNKSVQDSRLPLCRQVEDTMAQMMHLRMRPPKEVGSRFSHPPKHVGRGVEVKIGSLSLRNFQKEVH